MNTNCLLLLLCCCFTITVFPQQNEEIPDGWYSTVYDYFRNPGRLKSRLRYDYRDSVTDISEVEISTPIRLYMFKGEFYESLDTLDVNMPVMSMIRPSKDWIVFLTKRGIPVMVRRMMYLNNKWKMSGSANFIAAAGWYDVRETFPEQSGITIIPIQRQGDIFIHVPRVNDRNLTLLKKRADREKLKEEYKIVIDSVGYNKNTCRDIESTLAITTDSYDKLVDSRVTFGFFKEKWLRGRNGTLERSDNHEK